MLISCFVLIWKWNKGAWVTWIFVLNNKLVVIEEFRLHHGVVDESQKVGPARSPNRGEDKSLFISIETLTLVHVDTAFVKSVSWAVQWGFPHSSSEIFADVNSSSVVVSPRGLFVMATNAAEAHPGILMVVLAKVWHPLLVLFLNLPVLHGFAASLDVICPAPVDRVRVLQIRE